MQETNILDPIVLSLKVATCSTIIAFFIGTFFAYFLTKRNMKGKNIIETILTLPLVLPPTILGYYLLTVFGTRRPIGSFLLEHFNIRITFTITGAIIAGTVVAIPLMYQNIKSAFLGVDSSYEQAARTLGSSEFKILRTILLPMAWPGIVSGIALSFARALGEFGATMMIGGSIPKETETIAISVYNAVQASNNQLANKLVLIMTAFSFLLIIFLNIWLKKKDFNSINR